MYVFNFLLVNVHLFIYTIMHTIWKVFYIVTFLL